MWVANCFRIDPIRFSGIYALEMLPDEIFDKILIREVASVILQDKIIFEKWTNIWFDIIRIISFLPLSAYQLVKKNCLPHASPSPVSFYLVVLNSSIPRIKPLLSWSFTNLIFYQKSLSFRFLLSNTPELLYSFTFHESNYIKTFK